MRRGREKTLLLFLPLCLVFEPIGWELGLMVYLVHRQPCFLFSAKWKTTICNAADTRRVSRLIRRQLPVWSSPREALETTKPRASSRPGAGFTPSLEEKESPCLSSTR